jgi:hypothetical protein
MINAMNKVLRDCIRDITMPFLDDILIKGCPLEEKNDETIKPDGCRKFVATHVNDCEKVMQRLEDARLTFSEEKSAFGQLGDHGRRTPMWAIRSENVSGQGRGHLRDKERLQFDHESPEILGSMCVLLYLDFVLHPHRGAALWVVEEKGTNSSGHRSNASAFISGTNATQQVDSQV